MLYGVRGGVMIDIVCVYKYVELKSIDILQEGIIMVFDVK